jgi:hypothetical protein
MSYAASAALQSAIFTKLSGAPALAGVSVVDAMPPGVPAGSFVLLGPEVAIDQSDKTGAGVEHRVDIAVISDAAGFLPAKTIAAAISNALVGATMTLSVGHLVSITFLRADAVRLDDGSARRINMQFRARIDF